LGTLGVWQLGLASLASGLVWASDMAVRRRMVGEAAGEQMVAPAIALDSMTSSVTRMLGPILGGLAFERLGVTGAFTVAMFGYLASIAASAGLRHSQRVQPLALRAMPSAIAEAARLCARMPVLRSVLIVTVLMNVFGFSYTTVLPSWGEQAFGASPTMIGLLAGAEPFGALFGAWLLATFRIRLSPTVIFTAGAALFMIVLGLAANMPWLPLAWLLLALGGLGTAAFGSMQTSLVILNVGSDARSRVLGLVTTCIGMGPAGVLVAGALVDRFGPVTALTIMAAVGAALVIASRQRERA
jgi:MFS family permease